MQLTVGRHRFSGKDARRTLLHAVDFLDDYPAAAHPHQGDRRERIAAAVAGIDLRTGDAEELARPLAAVWAELLSARQDLIAAGGLPSRSTGSVVQLSVSDGGVPKRSAEHVDVDESGVVGDRQATRNPHGSPFQALCIWNLESVDHLASLGHPIMPGAAGENVTMSGIDWPSVMPGVRLRIGSVLGEVSSYAEPCKQNARWFSDGDFTRIHNRNGPWSRMYCTVLEAGEVRVGEPVVLEPASS